MSQHQRTRRGLLLLLMALLGSAFSSPALEAQDRKEPRPGQSLRVERGRSLASLAQPISVGARGAVVELLGEDATRVLALGTLVTPEGHLVTKASRTLKAQRVRLPGGELRAFDRIAERSADDLVLLRVRALEEDPPFEHLRLATPKAWRAGRLLVSVGRTRRPLALGVASGAPRRIEGRGGWLGIEGADAIGGGVAVRRVVEGTPAERAGLLEGDLITSLDEEDIVTFDRLRELLGECSPGQGVRLQGVRSGGDALDQQVRLGVRPVRRARGARRGEDDAIQGPRSERRDAFPSALQHDGQIGPAQVGGPLMDLKAQCLGINIARASRTTTLAIPAPRIAAWLRKLKVLPDAKVASKR